MKSTQSVKYRVLRYAIICQYYRLLALLTFKTKEK